MEFRHFTAFYREKAKKFMMRTSTAIVFLVNLLLRNIHLLLSL